MASAHRCWSSAMGRAVMRATTSTRTLTSSPGRRRLLHSMGDADADAQPAWRRTPTKQEVDPLLQNIDYLVKKELLCDLTKRLAKEQRGAITSPWLFGGSSMILFLLGFMGLHLEDDDDQQDLKNNEKLN